MKLQQTNQVLAALLIIIVGVVALGYVNTKPSDMEHMREDFIASKNSIIDELIHKGDYACCLKKACTYCIEKTPGHGEGATCNCLKDVVTGVHPCGECIGEIMEGHGNPFLAQYFARAISEEVGEKYYTSIASIISDKYDISMEDQLK